MVNSRDLKLARQDLELRLDLKIHSYCWLNIPLSTHWTHKPAAADFAAVNAVAEFINLSPQLCKKGRLCCFVKCFKRSFPAESMLLLQSVSSIGGVEDMSRVDSWQKGRRRKYSTSTYLMAQEVVIFHPETHVRTAVEVVGAVKRQLPKSNLGKDTRKPFI